MEWNDEDDEFMDDDNNDETFGDMDDTFELGALPAFFGNSVAGDGKNSKSGAALLLKPEELERMNASIKKGGGEAASSAKSETRKNSVEKVSEEKEDNLVPADLLKMDSNRTHVSHAPSVGDLEAQMRRSAMMSASGPPRGPMMMGGSPMQPRGHPMHAPRGHPMMMRGPPMHPRGHPMALPPPPPGFMYVHPPPPEWRPGMPVPIVPIGAVDPSQMNMPRPPFPRGPPATSAGARPPSAPMVRPPRSGVNDFPSLAEAAKMPKGARTQPPREVIRAHQERAGKSQGGHSVNARDRRQNNNNSSSSRNSHGLNQRVRQQPNRPVRMHLRDIDFVVKIQMRALQAITNEDDFYYMQWVEKRVPSRAKVEGRKPSKSAAASVAAILRTTRSAPAKVGENADRAMKAELSATESAPSKPRRRALQTPAAEAKSRAVKSRAWAETQKTLGFKTKSSLKAPRKLLDLGLSKGGEESKTEASGSFASSFWKTRIEIEAGLSILLQLEDALRKSAAKVDDLRASLFDALKLPHCEKDASEDSWPGATSHAWTALPFLRSEKGKKLILRSLDLFDSRRRNIYLWVLSRNLPLLLFSERKDADMTALNTRASETIVRAFGDQSNPLVVLAACLRQIATKNVYDDSLLYYLLQNPVSAAVLESLLGHGEDLASNSDSTTGDVKAWKASLASLQVRAGEAAESQGE
eukprot:g4358.t1